MQTTANAIAPNFFMVCSLQLVVEMRRLGLKLRSVVFLKVAGDSREFSSETDAKTDDKVLPRPRFLEDLSRTFWRKNGVRLLTRKRVLQRRPWFAQMDRASDDL